MRKLASRASALLLAGYAAGALALPQAAEFEQCGTVEGPQVSVSGFTLEAEKSAADATAEMRRLHQWLNAEAAALPKRGGIRVSLDRSERQQIGEFDMDGVQPQADQRRLQVGVGKPVNLTVDLSRLAASKRLPREAAEGGLRAMPDGGFVWTTKLASEGAHALRVVFRGLDLPDAAELYVYNKAGEAFGPYYGRGQNDSGELYSNTLTGDEATVQLRWHGKADARSLKGLRFEIAELAHIGRRFELARWINPEVNDSAKAFCSYNANCIVNGECVGSGTWAPIDNVRRAAAHMLFPSGGSYYICSGGLLNNTANDGRPLFLTANHCLSKSQSASGLEAFFDFRASSCNDSSACDLSYTTMRQQFPRVLGSTILATGRSGDFTLLELSAVPSGTRHFMGFSTTAVANSGNTALYRISHPSGAPQAYSRQTVYTGSGICGTLPRGTYIYSTDTNGATEGGSSGSPVLNAAGQVVGQLYGACGTNLNDVCDSGSNRTVDGALANYYGSVSAFLDPGTGGGGGGGGGDVEVTVQSVSVTVSQKGPNREATATVRIVDGNGNGVAGANVSGSFSGAVSGSGSGTTGSDGRVQIKSARFRNSGSVSFCVNSVGGDGIVYNGSAVCGSGG